MTIQEQVRAENETPAYPLVVDLDGTLVKADSLHENVVSGLLHAPGRTLKALASLAEGRSAFKRRMASMNVLDVSALPVRNELVEFLRQERERGRELHLVTAADQSIADAMAARTGLFASAVGSTKDSNLKGGAKSRFLQRRFPGGFSYAGDSTADIEVWERAKSAVLVGASGATKRAVAAMRLPVEREFEARPASLGTWLKALRAHQWAKNGLMLVPLFLGQLYTDPSAVMAALLGCLCLCVLASGTYLLNDIHDLEADRQHKTKRNRPIAAGDIGVAQAMAVAVLAILTGLAGAAALSLPFLGLLTAYLVTTTSYSLYFKRVPVVDIFALSFLYGLRVYMGMVLVGAPFSNWLLSFSLLFFFSLSACKRHVEIVNAGARGAGAKILGRGYVPQDAPFTLAFGVSSGIVAVLILFLYLVNDAFPAGAYSSPQWLWLIGYCVFIWLARVWFLSHRGELDADPVAFALRDPMSLVLGAVVAAMFVLAVL